MPANTAEPFGGAVETDTAEESSPSELRAKLLNVAAYRRGVLARTGGPVVQ